jgi:hypothetical protein
MRKTNPLLLLLLSLCLTTQSSLAQENIPVLADLTEIWTQINPGGETVCSTGDPYSFFVHPGTSDNLLIYFDGGGMCWNAETCGLRQSQLFTESIAETAADISTGYGGIFDLANPENPFAADSMVFVPYCTADLHMGNSTVTYGEGDAAVEIQHKGFVNASAALDWTYANFASPERIFITGVSAGSPGAIFHTPFIMEHYQDVPVSELGDSGGGWRVVNSELTEAFTNWGTIPLLPDWIEGFDGVTAETLSFETLYTATAAAYPDNRFAQYNTAQDRVQNLYLTLMNPIANHNTALPASLDDISADTPNFRSYTAGGLEHGIIGGGLFYTYAVDGLRLRDWVSDLAFGDLPDTVICSVCYKAETIAPSG